MVDKIIVVIDRVIRKISKEAYAVRIKQIFPNISCHIGKDLFVLGQQNIRIKEEITIGDNCVITAWESWGGDNFNPSIIFGSNCNIGCYNHISAINKIIIGDNLLTGRWVTITDHAHGKSSLSENEKAPIDRALFSKGPVVIGDNVWIGDKVTILPNVTIGNNVTIGANSVVTKDIPNNCIAVGNPIRILNKTSK